MLWLIYSINLNGEENLIMEIFLAIISAVISAISVVISVLAFIRTRKLNNINLRAEMVRGAYTELLLINIPKSREYIHYNGEKITGVDKLLDNISNVRRRSLYFKGFYEAFYKNLTGLCQTMEEKLNDIDRRYTTNEFQEYLNSIDADLEKLYDLIGKIYEGNV